MDITAFAALAVIAAIFSVMLRRYHAEYGVFISVACGGMLLAVLLQQLLPAIQQINSFFQSSGMPEEYVIILFKSLGICYITQFAADTCRDAGESALAAKAEVAGRISILLLSLPLFEEISQIVSGLAGG